MGEVESMLAQEIGPGDYARFVRVLRAIGAKE
jgi:hypothetical protein